MADIEKNIIIQPNSGTANAVPEINFISADASTNAKTISLKVYPTSNGTLSFEGNTGQLFSITDSMSGTIFSVNDISGIPSIEVLDTGLVKIAQYSGNVAIGRANANSKLDVLGDVNVSDVYKIGGVTVLTSTTISDIQNINTTQNTNITAVFTKANSAITLGSTNLYLGSTNTVINGLDKITSNTLTLNGNVAASNTSSGTLVVNGGIGVTGDIDITGSYKVNGVKFNSYLYTATIGDATSNSINVTHNLNNTNIIVSVRETISGIVVYPSITFINTNTIKLDFVAAPTLNQYSVSMIALPNNESSYTANVGNGTNNVIVVTHNLNKTNIITSVKEISSGIIVYPDINYSNTNSLTLTFVSVPTANQYSVSIIGL